MKSLTQLFLPLRLQSKRGGTIAQELKRSDPDNIAIWSVEPFDATQGPNWADIESTLNAIARKKTVVEQITQQDLVVAAEKISVLSQCT